MKKDDLEISLRSSVKTEPRDLVLSSEEGRFLVLIVPLPCEKEEEGGFDLPWKKTFIEWLLKGRSVRTAAELSGISRRQAYRQKETDEVFRNAWELARKEST